MKIFSKPSKPTFPCNVKKPQIIQVELIKKKKRKIFSLSYSDVPHDWLKLRWSASRRNLSYGERRAIIFTTTFQSIKEGFLSHFSRQGGVTPTSPNVYKLSNLTVSLKIIAKVGIHLCNTYK